MALQGQLVYNTLLYGNTILITKELKLLLCTATHMYDCAQPARNFHYQKTGTMTVVNVLVQN